MPYYEIGAVVIGVVYPGCDLGGGGAGVLGVSASDNSSSLVTLLPVSCGGSVCPRLPLKFAQAPGSAIELPLEFEGLPDLLLGPYCDWCPVFHGP